MAKQKQEEPIKLRYRAYCHQCKKSFELSVQIYKCECGSEILTLTDHRILSSGYYVKGVRK